MDCHRACVARCVVLDLPLGRVDLMLAWWQSLSVHDAALIEVCVALLAAVIASNLKRPEKKMKAPKFTDTHRHQRPYADAAETSKGGYLARKFARIRSEEAAKRAVTQQNVQPMKRKAA